MLDPNSKPPTRVTGGMLRSARISLMSEIRVASHCGILFPTYAPIPAPSTYSHGAGHSSGHVWVWARRDGGVGGKERGGAPFSRRNCLFARKYMVVGALTAEAPPCWRNGRSKRADRSHCRVVQGWVCQKVPLLSPSDMHTLLERRESEHHNVLEGCFQHTCLLSTRVGT